MTAEAATLRVWAQKLWFEYVALNENELLLPEKRAD